MAKQTDNHNLPAKLELRRYFLRRYHADAPPAVLDCCQGSGVIWKRLRGEFDVASYWGVDQKPKKGRLKIDSVRILAQAGWTQNVVDIDTYGSPWKHWEAMLPNVQCPATVFLTLGKKGPSGFGGGDDAVVMRCLGIPVRTPKYIRDHVGNKFSVGALPCNDLRFWYNRSRGSRSCLPWCRTLHRRAPKTPAAGRQSGCG